MVFHQKETDGIRIQTTPGRVYRQYCHVPTGEVSPRLFDLSGKTDLNFKSLIWYLTIGGVPDSQTLFTDVICLPGGAELIIKPGSVEMIKKHNYTSYVTNDLMELSEPELIKKGVKAFRESVEFYFSDVYKNYHNVIPLSGGLDSRAILAVLLENIEARNISTYTYGTPNTFDFEIGNKVAKHAGTKHFSYDLSKYEYTFERLSEIAELSDGSGYMFHHAPIDWIRRDIDAPNSQFWVGYFGEVSTGAHFTARDEVNPKDIILRRNQYGEVNVEELLLIKANDLDWNPITKSAGELSDVELWDMDNRQEMLISPHVLLRGFQYSTPFNQQKWLSFALSLPPNYRKRQWLYKRMLTETYPDLFSLPTKNTSGRSLKSEISPSILSRVDKQIHRFTNKIPRVRENNRRKRINYVDFNQLLISRIDLRDIISHSLTNLKTYDFINQKYISRLEDSMTTNPVSAETMMLLTSLEFNLRHTTVPSIF